MFALVIRVTISFEMRWWRRGEIFPDVEMKFCRRFDDALIDVTLSNTRPRRRGNARHLSARNNRGAPMSQSLPPGDCIKLATTSKEAEQQQKLCHSSVGGNPESGLKSSGFGNSGGLQAACSARRCCLTVGAINPSSHVAGKQQLVWFFEFWSCSLRREVKITQVFQITVAKICCCFGLNLVEIFIQDFSLI